MNKTHRTVLWITETAALLAMLVVVQYLTQSTGQYVTGSCVNAIIAVATLCAGLSSGLCVALLSPFLAFLVGVGPSNFLLIPFIALGNSVFSLLIALLGKNGPVWRIGLSVVVGACAKCAVLYLSIVKGVCVLANIPAPQVAKFTAMFSLPQLATALIGGAVAMILVLPLRKALSKLH